MKRKIALCGLLVALAFVFSYLESLLPIPIGIPGIKLGLANAVVLTALYLLRPTEAAVIALLRIVLAGLTFGSPATMLYALAGGVLSFAVMWVCRRSSKFSVTGVSMAGGVSHNVGQLLVAAAVLQTRQLLWYVPVLLLSGLLTGWLIGTLVRLLLPRLQGIQKGR